MPRSHRGADDAFRRVYDEHVAAIWRYARARLPDADAAADVTSDVFTRAAGSWSRYDPDRGPVGAWLAGIASHAVADWWRARGREVPVAAVPEAAGGSDPEAQAVAADDVAALRRSLSVLTDREREALALRFGAGLKAAEVAAVMGLTEGAAKMVVHRAVRKLREVMAHG